MSAQPSILAPVPSTACSLVFGLRGGVDARAVLPALADLDMERAVVGLGAPLARALGSDIAGLRPFPALVGPGPSVPSTQGALWVALRDGDRGELHHRARALCAAMPEGVLLEERVALFKHRDGRDLSGYEDGTENPKGDEASRAALVAGRGPGIDGGSFVAVQKWVHDLDRLAAIAPEARDALVGRRLSDNEELGEAPPQAHVKRSAQESFAPPAFMVRRSMPWVAPEGAGLFFVAYGESLDRFERVLRRMVGLEDGVTDGLFRFSRAVSGGYYFCPPMRDGRLDLSALGT